MDSYNRHDREFLDHEYRGIPQTWEEDMQPYPRHTERARTDYSYLDEPHHGSGYHVDEYMEPSHYANDTPSNYSTRKHKHTTRADKEAKELARREHEVARKKEEERLKRKEEKVKEEAERQKRE